MIMKVKIEYFSVVREIVGTRAEEVDVREGATVGELLSALVERHGDEFGDRVLEGGRLRELIHVLLDGRDVRTMKGLETPLTEGGTVSIFPPVGGG